MAISGNNINSIGPTHVEVLLGTSSEFHLQNTSNRQLNYIIIGDTGTGGVIAAGETSVFNYDIEVWCAFANSICSAYVTRD